jgi:hypothetical protein
MAPLVISGETVGADAFRGDVECISGRVAGRAKCA